MVGTTADLGARAARSQPPPSAAPRTCLMSRLMRRRMAGERRPPMSPVIRERHRRSSLSLSWSGELLDGPSARLSAVSVQPPADHQSLVRGFVVGIASSEMSGFSALAPPGVAPLWSSVRETLDKHERIAIHSFSWTLADETTGLVRLDLESSGVVVGLRREERALPSVWYLTIRPTADGPRIANAETEANRVGRLLSEAKSDPEMQAIRARHGEVPLLDIVLGINSYYARPFGEGDIPAVHAALEGALGLAQSENDLAAEVATLIHLSSLTMRESGDPTTPEASKLPKEDESRRIAKVAVELAR